jgi:hypothetical protein
MAQLKNLTIQIQPNDLTCGPTCLHALYHFYNDQISLDQVISEVSYLKEGGTLAVLLGCHALERGYAVTLFSYNLHVFDPSWFRDSTIDLRTKLSEQIKYKKGRRLHEATGAYLDFIKKGGMIRFEEFSMALLKDYFEKEVPVLSGLNATYLYSCRRERVNDENKVVYDDLKGYPAGHFIVLRGYDKLNKNITVADPYEDNPLWNSRYYDVNDTHLLNSIMLGIVTYDSNLLVIEPRNHNA